MQLHARRRQHLVERRARVAVRRVQPARGHQQVVAERARLQERVDERELRRRRAGDHALQLQLRRVRRPDVRARTSRSARLRSGPTRRSGRSRARPGSCARRARCRSCCAPRSRRRCTAAARAFPRPGSRSTVTSQPLSSSMFASGTLSAGVERRRARCRPCRWCRGPTSRPGSRSSAARSSAPRSARDRDRLVVDGLRHVHHAVHRAVQPGDGDLLRLDQRARSWSAVGCGTE